ncbi:MAG: hypothetical protein IPJ48_16530 [Propionivibrio sp.]|uniref:Uncharacterized protein n=1 Tax=Candidatus Propionivibrio dominans TaxID=2954373 RepID=A0A9D7FGU6_9RHOO|nr:hypothetical protein [Candidatus Propionivibrio dominans]
MAYEDKDDTKFPTRFGQATGHANERTMLDELGGANGIRHRQRLGPDGVTTHVKTRGGHPHFWNEPLPGGEETPLSPIYMDSGVVDLISVAPEDPRSILPAPLYYGNIERTYAANKKLLGKIAPPDIDTTTTTAPEEDVPGESFVAHPNMFGKKDCAAKCPASMFTGKARLYAQAQYGAPSKNWKWNLDIPLGLSPRLVHDNGFVMNINTGVYRDATFKHWFVTMYPDGIQFVRMTRSRSAEPLVELLQDAAFQDDWDKIEAYILAYSSPSATEQYVLTTHVPETQMLGYGWKFNWDGDTADVIQHLEGFPTHRTTHYRFEFERDTGPGYVYEIDRWTAELSVVDGPYEWHNSKYAQVIANPDWLTNTLSLFGTRSGGIVPGNPPVYCFYKRNTLETFRYFASGGEASLKYSRTATPPPWGLTCDWTSDGWVAMNATVYDLFGTFGTDGGSGEWRQRLYNPVTTGFSCSTASTVSSSESYTYEKRGLGGKTLGPDASGGYDSDAHHGEFLQQNVNTYLAPSTVRIASDGVPLMLGSATITQDDIPGSDGNVNGGSRYHTYYILQTKLNSLSFQSGGHTESDSHLLLIPFHDAQACYVYGTRNTYRLYDGWEGDSADSYSGSWGTKITMATTYDGGYTYVQEGDWIIYLGHSGSYGLPPSPTYYTGREETTDTILASSLVTDSGVYGFSPPISMGVFFSGVDLVEQTFYTHSSTLGAVYGHGANNLEGFPDRFPSSPPPFIGWA